VTDLLRAGQGALLATFVAVNRPAPALCCIALMSGSGAIFSAARPALIATVVDRTDLPRANGLMALTSQLALVTGPALAALLLTRVGPVPAVVFDSLTFVASAAVLTGLAPRSVRSRTRPPSDQSRLRADGGTSRAANVVLRAIVADRGLSQAIGAALLVAVSAGVNNTVMVLFLDHDLRGRPSDVAWLSAANGIAQIIAGGTVVAFARRLPARRTLAAAVSVMGAFTMVLAASPVTAAAVTAVVVVALANSPFNIAYTTLRQTAVKNDLIGRVFATSTAGASLAFLLGSLGGGLLADHSSARLSLAVSALCMVCAALVASPLLWSRPSRVATDRPAQPTNREAPENVEASA
jgi:predicted MFS family arabinose efflux permease